MKKEHLVFLLFALFVWSSRDHLPPEFQFWKKSHSFVRVVNHSGQDLSDVTLVIWSAPNSLGVIKKDKSRELSVKRLRDHTDVIIRFKYGNELI